MKHCKKCGFIVPEEKKHEWDTHCVKCGHALTFEMGGIKFKLKRCPKCGWCTSCGDYLNCPVCETKLTFNIATC